MLDNCSYNHIKLLHDLSQVAWYLEKSCKSDVATCGHETCQKMLPEVEAQLSDLISKISQCQK